MRDPLKLKFHANMYDWAVMIDDSKLDLFLAEAMMKAANFARVVTTFNKPEAALAQFHALALNGDRMPDVIFVDIQMPLMTGFEFVNAWLLIPEWLRRDTKLVMISSTRNEEDFARIRENPAVTKFVAKPMSIDLFRQLEL